MINQIRWIQKRVVSAFSKRTRPECLLEIFPAGIRVSINPVDSKAGVLYKEWSDIQAVKVFKRDLFTYDLICLSIQFTDSTTIELHEEMSNWQMLLDSLPSQLPGCLPFEAWFDLVAFPAFATNETLIFSRLNKQAIQE